MATVREAQLWQLDANVGKAKSELEKAEKARADYLENEKVSNGQPCSQCGAPKT